MNTERFRAEIDLNARQAQSELKKLEEQQKRLKDQQKALYESSSAKNHKLAADMQKDIDNVSTKIREQKKYINGLSTAVSDLSKASYKELAATVRALNKELRSGEIPKESAQFKAMADRIKECRREMNRYNEATREQQSFWGRAADSLNKYQTAITTVAASMAGLTLTIRKCVSDYAEMEDTMADVRKYTGQTDAQVREMNEDFKNMDTRTSREQLNELAGAAGRLGKTSKEDIEEFVDAADKINVALGDDLGDGAVDKIGKLANAFDEDKKKGLRGAMLSTGSALNELAQASSANAGYIVDFTADLAGVGKQAGMTQAQIMGLGSALDQNMQEEATASTVFSQLITKMYQDPAKFAKIAGVEVGKFTTMLKTDANQALLTFLQAMQNKGGFAEMAPMFQSMNLDGTRAVGVLSSVATHLDEVKEAQALATKEYAKGTSVLNEFNINNNTANAELDKAKKRFKDLSIELGEKLEPVARYTITSTSALVNILSTLIDFTSKYSVTLITLTTIIAAYTIAVNAATIKTKLLAFWNDVVVTSFKKLWAIVAANPWAAAVAGAAMMIAIFVDLTRKTDEQAAAQKRLQKIKDDAIGKMQEEKQEIDILVKAAQNDRLSMEDREAAIKKLNKIIPGYNAKLDEETGKYQANTQALKEYNAQLEKKYELEGARDVLRELGKKHAEAQQKVNEAKRELKEAENAGVGVTYTTSWGMVGNTSQDLEGHARSKLSQALGELRQVKTEIKAVQDTYGQALQQEEANNAKKEQQKNKPGKTGGGTGGGGHTGGGSGEDINAKIAKQLKAQYDTAVLYENLAYAKGEVLYRDHLANLDKLQQDYIDQRKARLAESSDEYAQACVDEVNFEIDKISQKKELDEKDIEQNRQVNELKLRQSIYDEDQLNEAIFQNEISALQQRLALYKKGSDEYFDISMQIQNKELQHRQDNERKYQEKLAQLREQYGKMSNEEQESLTIDGLNELHKMGLIKEEEYQQMLKAIKLKYVKEQSENDLKFSKNEIFKRNASDAAKIASNEAKADWSDNHEKGPNVGSFTTQDIAIFGVTLANLKKMEKEGVISHEEAMAAMTEATAHFCGNLTEKMKAAYDAVSPIMDAMSSYYSAQSEYEVNVTEKKYQKLIDAAGNNSAKSKKLEEKKEKEVAKIKTKYAKKQVKMQIAQAIAQTAMSAIAAYGSAMSGVPYPANMVLAPIAAGIALAAGAIQIATVKKQQQAQEAGYYEGGYTGGNRYRREAGVVHEGEFVANHQAVNNRNLQPVFSLIDEAQKNNRVASLTAEDVTRQLGSSANVQVAAPVVNLQTDNSDLKDTLEQTRDTLSQVGAAIDNGIKVDWESFDRGQRHWNNLKGNK